MKKTFYIQLVFKKLGYFSSNKCFQNKVRGLNFPFEMEVAILYLLIQNETHWTQWDVYIKKYIEYVL